MVRRLALAAVALILLSLAGGDGMGTSMSPLQRTILASNPVAYWPLEDPDGATIISSGLSGGSPMRIVKPVILGASGLGAGTTSGVDVAESGQAVGEMSPAGMTSWSASWVQHLVTPDTSTIELLRIEAGQVRITALISFFEVIVGLSNTSTGAVSGSLNSGFVADSSSTVAAYHMTVTVTQDGADIDATMRVNGSVTDTTTLTASTLGAPQTWRIGDGLATAADTSLVLGHLAIFEGAYTTDLSDAMDAYAGELASVRFARLCEESGVAYDVAGTSAQQMGPQATAELMPLLRQCEAVDGGVIVERRTGELGFDSVESRYNIATSLTLDYDASTIDDIAPTDDDQLTGNDWTITRSGGGSARVEQTDGPMGTDPVTGAGTYEKSATLNLYEDEQAVHQAGWRVWL